MIFGVLIRSKNIFFENNKNYLNILQQKYAFKEFHCSSTNKLCRSSRNSHPAAVSLAFTSFLSDNPRPDAPPVVIMHGLLGSKMNWKSLAKQICQLTRRNVYTVDARNHGDSPHTDTFNYFCLGEDVIHFSYEQSFKSACLIGHSMGGRAMMAAALKKPDIVEKLFILDISPIGVSDSISTLPRFVEIMNRIALPPGLSLHNARKFVDDLIKPIVPESSLRAFLLANLTQREGSFFWKANLSSISKNFNPHISTFPPAAAASQPFDGECHFIGGALSNYIDPSDHEQILALFPRATFSYIVDAGHWLHADKPKEFLQIITNLIND